MYAEKPEGSPIYTKGTSLILLELASQKGFY